MYCAAWLPVGPGYLVMKSRCLKTVSADSCTRLNPERETSEQQSGAARSGRPRGDERARALREHDVNQRKQKMDAQSLMRQAGMTAEEYLNDGIRCIDRSLGKGFAKDHPELIAAFMRTAALDFASVFVTEQVIVAIRDAAEIISGSGHE